MTTASVSSSSASSSSFSVEDKSLTVTELNDPNTIGHVSSLIHAELDFTWTHTSHLDAAQQRLTLFLTTDLSPDEKQTVEVAIQFISILQKSKTLPAATPGSLWEAKVVGEITWKKKKKSGGLSLFQVLDEKTKHHYLLVSTDDWIELLPTIQQYLPQGSDDELICVSVNKEAVGTVYFYSILQALHTLKEKVLANWFLAQIIRKVYKE